MIDNTVLRDTDGDGINDQLYRPPVGTILPDGSVVEELELRTCQIDVSEFNLEFSDGVRLPRLSAGQSHRSQESGPGCQGEALCIPASITVS